MRRISLEKDYDALDWKKPFNFAGAEPPPKL